GFAEIASQLLAIGAAGGVRLRLEGDLAALDSIADPLGPALHAALEQCVVNVARHAGVTEAWLAVSRSGDELSITVVDEGVGFDPDAVPHDRLGLSESVRGRIERLGGTVRVWSSPGAGTSVHLVVPWGAGG
ncbi:ATP-binding protein, partial [Schumannella luteola]